MDLEIVTARSNKPLLSLPDLLGSLTVAELKRNIASRKPKYRDVNRCWLISDNDQHRRSGD